MEVDLSIAAISVEVSRQQTLVNKAFDFDICYLVRDEHVRAMSFRL